MSELAAFILLAFKDDLGHEGSDPHLKLLLSSASLESSTFIMFDQLMKLKLKELYRFETKDMKKKYELPINKRVHDVMKKLLRAVDGKLFEHLHGLKFEPMICCLRWVRLLFLREFSFEQNLILWDFLFVHLSKSFAVKDRKELKRLKNGDDQNEKEFFDVIDMICAGIFMHLRQKLLACDNFTRVISLVQNPPEVDHIGEIVAKSMEAESKLIRIVLRVRRRH